MNKFSKSALLPLSILSLILSVPSAFAAQSILGNSGDLTITTPSATGGNVIINSQQAPTNNGLYINTSNNIGMGTNNPQTRLHISAAWDQLRLESADETQVYSGSVINMIAGSVPKRFDIQVGAAANTRVGAGNFGIFDFTNNAARLVINQTGNVGIGTTSPNYLLHLETTGTTLTNNLKVNAAAASGNYGEIAFQTWSGAGSGLNTFGGVGTSRPSVVLRGLSEDNAAKGAFVVATFSGGADNTNLTEKLRVTSAGNVGIGTTSPNAVGNSGTTLSIRGATADGNLSLETAQTQVDGARAGRVQFVQPDMTNGNREVARIAGFTSGATSNNRGGYLSLYTKSDNVAGDPVERLRIDNTGNVGIGATVPGALLDLGTAGTKLGVVRLAGSTSGNVTVQPAAAAGTWTLTLPTSAGTSGQYLQTNGSGVTTWASAGGGSVTSVTGTAPVVSSGGTTPAISMPVATTSANGYLSSTDWTTFNAKAATGACTAGQYVSGITSSAVPTCSTPSGGTTYTAGTGLTLTGSAFSLTNPVSATTGGTGTSTAFTSGSVVFAGASGVYTQNNSNLFWDNTNNRLGIATTTPQEKLDVNGAIRFGDTASACDATHRGDMKFVQGTPDVIWACMMNSSSTFNWVQVARGS